MKILKITVAFLILSTSSVFSQDKTAEEKAAEITERLTTELSLTEEQATKIEALNVDFITSKRSIKADKSLSEDQQKEKLKDARKLHKASVNEILTDEQEATLKAKKEAHKNMTPQDIADKMTEHMIEELDLTAEQIERVKILNLKVAQKIDVIRKDESMSKDKKKEFIKGNMKDLKNSLKPILTDEQFEKYKEMSKKMKEKHDHMHDEMD